ncbi:Uncharacterised protein [Mycobacterium tuberculosis]|nr:Uncharacterised protein [Mycobacterium tuberculosis]
MPRLTIAALINADTGLGASGWARGSQACSGTRPAFEPNPTSVSINTAARTPSQPAPRPANRSEPPAAANTTSPTRIAMNPS